MLVIGVTGGVGTGKSTVARLFGQLGCRVLDADEMTHTLMRLGQPIWRKIRASFGKEVLTSGRQIDRRRLGQMVFGDSKRLTRLCQIVHPAVRRQIRREIRRIRQKDPGAAVVLDIPLLIEAGSHYRLDALVVVSAPLKVVANRLHARSGWSLSEVKRRQAFQRPLRQKERMADFVVRNGGSKALTRRQVVKIWKRIGTR